ncbi:hypothetical protein ABTW72_20060 [Micromonospora sp. NPDC127501]|uniref:hypothetical protein n=1 Tax=Micromonospora sp. NPDC127501 TaxID=3154872 RepID=UPI00332A5EBE
MPLDLKLSGGNLRNSGALVTGTNRGICRHFAGQLLDRKAVKAAEWSLTNDPSGFHAATTR